MKRVGWVWETAGVSSLITDPTSQAGVLTLGSYKELVQCHTNNFRGYSCNGDIHILILLTAPQLKAGQITTETILTK